MNSNTTVSFAKQNVDIDSDKIQYMGQYKGLVILCKERNTTDTYVYSRYAPSPEFDSYSTVGEANVFYWHSNGKVYRRAIVYNKSTKQLEISNCAAVDETTASNAYLIPYIAYSII